MASIEWTEARTGGHRLTIPWRGLVHWLVVGVALAYLAWRIPDLVAQFGATGVHVDHTQWAWLAVAALAAVGALAAYGELYRRLLLVKDVRLPTSTLQGINFAHNALSTTVPVVGGAGSLGYAISQLRRRGVNTGLATWAVLLAGVITSVVLIVVGALGLVWAGDLAPTVGFSLAAFVGFGFAGAWTLVGRSSALNGWLGKLSAQLSSLRPSGRQWLALVGVALVSWVLDFVALVASAAATGISVPGQALVAGFLVVQGSIALQILPGGAGLAETGLLGVLLGSGVAGGAAAVTVLFYRALTWLGLALVGWIVYAVVGQRSATRAPAQSSL